MSKILVAYFSASGVTKKTAENLAKAIDADLYEIQPKIPYTQADLNWTDKKSRSSVEMLNTDFRPEIVQDNIEIAKYDTIFLGFPIWWYIAPTIINTFLEAYDFSNKKIILFATSGGSGFGETLAHLRFSVSDSTKLIEGKLLNRNTSADELKKWAETVL